MPKLKTHKGAAKRFRRTTTGFKHKRMGKNHKFTNKAPKRKRQLRGFNELATGDRDRMAKLLPNKAR